MEGLDHERADAGQWEGTVAVDAPDHAARAEQSIVGGVLGNGALVSPSQRFERAQPGGVHSRDSTEEAVVISVALAAGLNPAATLSMGPPRRGYE